jgi:copper(I)-binding protein
MRLLPAVGLALLVVTAPVADNALLARIQPTVRVSTAWIQAPAAGSTEAAAFVAVDNSTMYDVFIVGAETEVATIEIRDRQKGGAAAVVVKEVPVPAFGRLEMSPETVHLRLTALERPLKAGDTVRLVIYTDGGEQLAVSATVK